MAERLGNVDGDPPVLLPADLGEWVPQEDLGPFVITERASVRLPHYRDQPAWKRQRAIPAAVDADALDMLLCNRDLCFPAYRAGYLARCGGATSDEGHAS